MRVSLIAAVAANRTIGKDGQLPWHLPADLRHFRRLTWGHPVIMGRRTFESMGKPLPGRTNIVVTRGAFAHPGVQVARSVEEALALAAGDDEAFVAGGAEIYRAALPLADRLYLTEIDRDFPGDTHFPDFDRDDWSLVESAEQAPTDRIPYAVRFRTYERTHREEEASS
jgi:dihydrofolate reductase